MQEVVNNEDPLSSFVEEKSYDDDIFIEPADKDSLKENYPERDPVDFPNIELNDYLSDANENLNAENPPQEERKVSSEQEQNEEEDFFDGLDEDIFSKDLDLESDLNDLFEDINKQEKISIEDDELYPKEEDKKVYNNNDIAIEGNSPVDQQKYLEDDGNTLDNIFEKNEEKASNNEDNEEILLEDLQGQIDPENEKKLEVKKPLKNENSKKYDKDKPLRFSPRDTSKVFSKQENMEEKNIKRHNGPEEKKVVQNNVKNDKKANTFSLKEPSKENKNVRNDKKENKNISVEKPKEKAIKEPVIQEKIENKSVVSEKQVVSTTNTINKDLIGRLVGWLVSYKDPQGTAVEVREGKFFITKDPLKDFDFIIDDESISTPHALVTVSNTNGIMIQDLMSDAGIYLKQKGRNEYEQRSTPFKVNQGDWIKFGNVEYLVSLIAHIGE